MRTKVKMHKLYERKWEGSKRKREKEKASKQGPPSTSSKTEKRGKKKM